MHNMQANIKDFFEKRSADSCSKRQHVDDLLQATVEEDVWLGCYSDSDSSDNYSDSQQLDTLTVIAKPDHGRDTQHNPGPSDIRVLEGEKPQHNPM